MRKLTITSITILCMCSVLYAQNDKKDFSEILPKAGEYSIGLDMAKVIQFVGNSFSANGAPSYPNYNMIQPSMQSITLSPTMFGKYFLTDNLALRLRLGVGVNNTTTRDFVYDDVANIGNPLNDTWLTYAQTVDVRKLRNTQIELGIGVEMRKTLWRVQGYAGAEVFGAYIFKKEFYNYGNPMSATNQNPTTSDFLGSTTNPPIRLLDTKGGNTIRYGGGLYLGADFFIAKNISMGAEFDLFAYGSYITEEVGVGETWKMETVYVGERKMTPVCTGFDITPTGFFNINIYF